MNQPAKAIAILVHPVLRFPRNNRVFYLTNELLARGWKVHWMVPESGINEGVPVDELILRYADMNIRGRTYFLPIYLAIRLRLKGIRFLWLSGWTMTSFKEIFWLVRLLGIFGIQVVYDPIDPVCEFKIANGQLADQVETAGCHEKMKRIYAMCSTVLCVTPEMKALLAAHGADESKLFVARWGSDISLFNRERIKGDFRKRHNIDDDAVLVGWLGSMTKFKGLEEMLLPLMERIVKDGKVHFIIAGDGPLYDEIDARIKSRDNSSITLLGRVNYPEAAEFTAALDVYLVTTNPDSEYARAICPVKCYDALAVGTPLVTTRTPATEHLAEISAHVWLCDYNRDSFENAVRHLVKNIAAIRKSRSVMSGGGVTMQGVSKEIADMLEQLCASERCS